MSVMRRLILLAVIGCVMPGRADENVNALRQGNTSALDLHGQDRALMVRDRDLAASREATAELLLFCRQRGVTALFVSCYGDLPEGYRYRERLFRWRQFLSEAHRQGLAIYASTGNVGWINDTGQALRQVDSILRFSQNGAPGEGFDGLLLEFPSLSRLRTLLPAPTSLRPPAVPADQTAGQTPRAGASATLPRADERPLGNESGRVETADLFPTPAPFDPGQLAPASLEDREYLRQHFALLSGLRQYLDQRVVGRPWRLGVSVPAWLQIPVAAGAEIKPALEHFIDLTDFTVVHNLPGETTAIGAVAENAVRYASEAGKGTYLRLELGYPARPEPELISLYQYDEQFLETVVGGLLERFGTAPGFAGVLLDDYFSYRRLPALREVEEPWRRPGPTVYEERFPNQPWLPVGGDRP